MERVAVLLVVAFLAGCGGSRDEAEPQASDATTMTTTETSTDSSDETPPRSYEEVMERLPPFDVPASPEVEAYRKATIGAFFDRCVNARAKGLKTRFVKANRALLAEMPVFPGARRISEYSIDQYDGNGCPEALGPPTSYTTYRNFRLPAQAKARDVIRFYERALAGWQRAFAATPTQCEQTFTRGDRLFAVRACGGNLTLTARALAPLEPPPAPKPPPRPAGAQYPATTDDPSTPDPDPTEYSVDPGTTCERDQASGPDGIVPIILPPPPGIEARIESEPITIGPTTYEKTVVVEWSFNTIHGDCPPSELILSYPAVTAYTIHEPVRAKSGVARMPLLDFVPPPKLVRATAVSVDGTHSRQVAVLVL